MPATGNITNPASAPKSATVLDAKGKARLQKAVKDFEAIFMGMMMKSMRSSVPDEEGAGQSFGGDVMESLFDDAVAKQMAGRSNLGLADMLYRSITKEPLPGSVPGAAGIQGNVTAANVLPAVSAAHDMNAASGGTRPVPASAATKSPVPEPDPRDSDAASPAGAWTVPSASTLDRIASYENIIQGAARAHGVDSTMLKAVIAAESAGNRNAVSPKDAKGLMQLTDSTAADMGVANVWNPRENIEGGAKYLRSLIQRFPDDTKSVIASYNAGPARVAKHGGVPPIPETQAYVKRVMNYMNFFEQEEAAHEGR